MRALLAGQELLVRSLQSIASPSDSASDLQITVVDNSCDDDEARTEALGSYGVKSAPFANRPISIPNDLDEAVSVLEREVLAPQKS